MALRVIATSLAEWAVLRFAVGYMLAALTYSAFGGKPMWVAAYNALAFAAYLTYAALGRVARNPFVWGAIRPVSVAMGVAAVAVFLFARGPHLAEAPGRISEVLAFSTHPGAVTMYLLAPMKEELLYRGILLRRLSSGLGLWPGLLVSSVVFGLLHPDPLQGAIVGLWLGWMYSPRFGGNLLLPIMAHCAFNLTAFPAGPVPVDFGF